jgi:hypothetical protein
LRRNGIVGLRNAAVLTVVSVIARCGWTADDRTAALPTAAPFTRGLDATNGFQAGCAVIRLRSNQFICE